MWAIDAYLLVSTSIIFIVMLRQAVLTILFQRDDRPVDESAADGDLPYITILIPAYNEERVLDDCLRAMRTLDYPPELMDIIVVNDRSRDGTGAIADRHADADERIIAIHRPNEATPGKPAALFDAIELIVSDVVVFFDADYVPPPGLVRKLVAPLAEDGVGATMGRVVPDNTDSNILTKLIDLERRAGYGVDLTMRQRLHLLPQFGGTCGAVSLSALNAVGGWKTDVLAEDTDLTYRLFINGYDVRYIESARCHEESPENWQVRFKQVRRWSYGHNDCLFRYFLPTAFARKQRLVARIDALIVLLLFFVPTLALTSLVLVIFSPLFGAIHGTTAIIAPSLLAFSAIGNFAPYYQVAAACIADGQPRAYRAAPLMMVSSFISLVASVAGLLQLVRDRIVGSAPRWDKTLRFRERTEQVTE